MYIWEKDSGFFFQIRIPVKHVEKFGRGHLRIWLGRVSRREAKRRAAILAGEATRGFAADMNRETLTRSLKALAEEIEALRREEFSAGFSAFAARNRLSNVAEYGDTLTHEYVAASKEKIAAGKARKDAIASVRQRLEKVGRALETDAAALTAERAAYAHALATIAAIERPAAVPMAPTPVAPPAASEDEHEHRDEREITADTLLSVAGKIVLDLRREAKGESATGDDRYQERLENALAAFIDVIGDKPLRAYLPLHMQEFATIMAKCPKNRKKYPQYNGLPIRKMVEVNAKSKKPIPTLSTSAVGSLVSEVTNLWAKATAGVSDVKDLKSYKITMPASARKAIIREGLPVSSLNIWMKAAAALYPRDDYKKYMPLVALLTGMRQGELVWLQPKDIVEIDGHTVIDLRKPLIINRREVNRSLKTDTSPRIVALHPFLRECGFIDWAKSRRHWVFGEYHRAKNPSHSAQRKMGDWMKSLGIHAEQKHVFHSLRHNAKHWLRGIGGDTGKLIADRQCGHAPGNVGDSYGFPVLQPDEIEKIEALPLPKGVDFSGFCRSR